MYFTYCHVFIHVEYLWTHFSYAFFTSSSSASSYSSLSFNIHLFFLHVQYLYLRSLTNSLKTKKEKLFLWMCARVFIIIIRFVKEKKRIIIININNAFRYSINGENVEDARDVHNTTFILIRRRRKTNAILCLIE